MNAVEIRGESALKKAIAEIAGKMAEAGDMKHAGKMEQLADKAAETVLNIAFCGHFSAGKSSMINKLCGHRLLPSSPIPTSANVVTLRNGEQGATVKHAAADGGKPVYAEIPLENLDEYCKDGERIESVSIHYPIPLLGDRAALLDTPGIDSTDEAHLMATESALHLADVVFYVMDYNHVQSEINFAFTKRLKEWGKPLYLIVNMIDKHREQELSFAEYRQSVVQAFESWHIELDGLLFISVKQPEHAGNEWEKLIWLLGRLMDGADSLRALSIGQSIRHLISEHEGWLSDRNEERKERLRARIEQEDQPSLQLRYAELQSLISEQARAAELLRDGLRKEAVSLLENANITPATTRDLAGHYLESRKPGFKLGFFARAAATAKEIETRLTAFAEDYASKVDAGIVWHLRGQLIQAGERYGIGAEAVDGALLEAKNAMDAAWLASQVQPGAIASNEYTLNYSRQLAAETKSIFRRVAFEIIDAIADAAAEDARRERAASQAELDRLSQRLEATHELQAIEREESLHTERLLALIPSDADTPRVRLPDLAQYRPGATAKQDPPVRSVQAAELRNNDWMQSMGTEDAKRSGESHMETNFRATMQAMSSKLAEACRLLAPIPSMQSVVRSLEMKSERLASSRFTISLFGAFSAGKSSFANALMGEAILPVSPNPTTAAINKIMPPDAEWPHGSVKVKMKSAQAIEEDVLFSLDVLGEKADHMEAALQRIADLSPEQVGPSGKPHYTFLKAVLKGWEYAKQLLGSEQRVDLEQFRAYVAEESKSCFVDFIELYYSCPLTEQGMILVDTPGADSINARHTGVAFNYIKNADAVLFVTYYNHAFSQADREFLLQLGRVKDSFELDKMFFLVNAADLAASREELEGVVGHVSSNLLRYGIRNPRIYPASSMMALEGKTKSDGALAASSGIVRFENDFVRFAVQELAGIAVRSASQELSRSVSLLDRWIADAQEGEEQRAKKLAGLKEAVSRAMELLDDVEPSAELKEAANEIQELLYYVKQRLSFRFSELFQYAFNPAALREDAGPIRSLMRAAWHELLRLISYDLSQELYATTLRVENALNRLAHKRYDSLINQIQIRVEQFEPETYEPGAFRTPAVQETMEDQPVEKWLAGFYKNGKHFFEGPGKNELKDALDKALAANVSAFVDRHGDSFVTEYSAQYAERTRELQQKLKQQLSEHAEGTASALEMKIDVGQLAKTREQLQSLIRS